MTSCKFVFDIIVTHIESSAVKLTDLSKLEVLANFNNVIVPITASRIKVSEFKHGAGVDITVVPMKLRQTLDDCGIAMTVSYNAKVIGTGTIQIPQSTLDQIDDGMSDLLYVDTCSFTKEGEVTGKLEMLLRLIIKCDEQTEGEQKSCKNMDKSINQQDILFVMSESQRCPSPCDPCLDALEPEEGDERLVLDLQRYRNSDAGGRRPAENLIHCPAANTACCQVKKMVQDAEKIVDSVTKSLGHPKPLIPPCRGTENLETSANSPEQFMPEEIETSISFLPCFSYLPAQQGNGADFCDPALIPVPISDVGKPDIKPSRFCHVCLANMSWLPKFAACPKCGVKPMPVVEERHKEKKITPDDIIDEYLGKAPDLEFDYCIDPCDKTKKKKGDVDECENCRCTCKCGKLCAHCRIRQLTAGFFKSTNKVCSKVMPKSSEDFCIRDGGPQECRPYLARVFSELRDLYDLKDLDLQPNEADCALKTGQRQPLKKNNNNAEATKSEKPIKMSQLSKPRDRKRTVLGPGHKNCVRKKYNVSPRHGWAWDVREEASKYGWQPGAIRKSVKKIMKFFLQYSPEDNSFNKCQQIRAEEKEKERQAPTLNVSKKDGQILVTLRALNNPNIKMNPIVFSVVKSDLAVALSEIKKKLKSEGFPKCTCHNTVMLCTCRSPIDKKHLEAAIQTECKYRGMDSCVDHLVLTDTSDSELEFDFDVTPPAGVAKPVPPKHRTLNNATQTMKTDNVVTRKYPIPINPFYRAYDCAAGDRYTGTAFGSPGEPVFEDGVFGYGGGGPHGPSASPGGKTKAAGVWGSKPGGPMRGGGRAGAGGGGGGGSGGAGGGGRGGAFGGGKGGPFGGPGGMGGPGGKQKSGPSAPIPVRMPKRFVEGLKKAVKEKKQAAKKELEKKKKGINTMEYLMKKGIVSKPWNPNDIVNEDKPNKNKAEPAVGADGLTDAQRKRRELNQMCIPPLDSMPRLGKGFDPCQCYQLCGGPQCCYPCCYC